MREYYSLKRAFHFSRIFREVRAVVPILARSFNAPLENARYISLLKVHKRENFLGFDFEICTFS